MDLLAIIGPTLELGAANGLDLDTDSLPGYEYDDNVSPDLSFYLILAATVLFLPAVFLSGVFWIIGYSTQNLPLKKWAGVVFVVALAMTIAAAVSGLVAA
jgi:hypothetical protein